MFVWQIVYQPHRHTEGAAHPNYIGIGANSLKVEPEIVTRAKKRLSEYRGNQYEETGSEDFVGRDTMNRSFQKRGADRRSHFCVHHRFIMGDESCSL